MGLREHYRILGVSQRATWEEIRRSYRSLVRALHPDLNPQDKDANANLRRVMEAYEAILAARSRASRSKSRAAYYRAPFTVSQEIFSNTFGITPEPSPAPKPVGVDFRYDLRIPFTAALLGMETVIQVARPITCPHCNGTGLAADGDHQVCPTCAGHGRRALGAGMLRFGLPCRRCEGRGKLLEADCPHCQGRGYQSQYQSYYLSIPAGTEDGARLYIKGEGGRGLGDGPRGDLEVVISVEPHAFFIRRGRDLYCQVKVSFAQAALGGDICVPTLTGHRLLKLPRGLQSGMTIRIPGGGVPASPYQAPGDQFIRVIVTTPENLSPGQRHLLEEFTRLRREEVSRAAHE